jgi:hypothetical protein
MFKLPGKDSLIFLVLYLASSQIWLNLLVNSQSQEILNTKEVIAYKLIKDCAYLMFLILQNVGTFHWSPFNGPVNPLSPFSQIQWIHSKFNEITWWVRATFCSSLFWERHYSQLHFQNRQPSKFFNNLSPFAMWIGYKPIVFQLKMWLHCIYFNSCKKYEKKTKIWVWRMNFPLKV